MAVSPGCKHSYDGLSVELLSTTGSIDLPIRFFRASRPRPDFTASPFNVFQRCRFCQCVECDWHKPGSSLYTCTERAGSRSG